jgi:hypothetical protein
MRAASILWIRTPQLSSLASHADENEVNVSMLDTTN